MNHRRPSITSVAMLGTMAAGAGAGVGFAQHGGRQKRYDHVSQLPMLALYA
jgi:hypothetical protein